MGRLLEGDEVGSKGVKKGKEKCLKKEGYMDTTKNRSLWIERHW